VPGDGRTAAARAGGAGDRWEGEMRWSASSTTPSMRRVRVREYMEVLGCACGENKGAVLSILSLYCAPGPVEDEDEDEDDDGAGRLLRRCWRYGMPRCIAR
jgi:hypothetical protein